MTILIVDDNRAILSGMIALPIWDILDLRVKTAVNVSGAINILESESIDIVLTDVKMPGRSGLLLCEYIQEKELGTDVIVMSAYQDFAYAQKAVELDVRMFLTKPVDISQLTGVINKMMLKRKLMMKVEKTPSLKYLSQDSKNSLLGSNAITAQMIDYIDDHINEPISLQMLSSVFRKSSSYISRHINEELHQSLPDYLNERRINFAKQMLRETDATVKMVCYEVGYSNMRHFLRTFKGQEQCTPTQFRQLYSKTE